MKQAILLISYWLWKYIICLVFGLFGFQNFHVTADTASFIWILIPTPFERLDRLTGG